MCDIPRNITINKDTSTQILARNETRGGLFIRNLSDSAVVSIGFCVPAEKNKGITLMPKESFSMTPTDYCNDAVNIISDKDNTIVAFQEFWYRAKYN